MIRTAAPKCGRNGMNKNTGKRQERNLATKGARPRSNRAIATFAKCASYGGAGATSFGVYVC